MSLKLTTGLKFAFGCSRHHHPTHATLPPSVPLTSLLPRILSAPLQECLPASQTSWLLALTLLEGPMASSGANRSPASAPYRRDAHGEVICLVRSLNTHPSLDLTLYVRLLNIFLKAFAGRYFKIVYIY